MSAAEPNSPRPIVSDEAFEGMLAEGTGTCPPPALLYAASEDVLPELAAAAIREHAAQCALCQALLSDREEDETSSFTPERSARVLAAIAVKQQAVRGGEAQENRGVVSIDAHRGQRRRLMLSAIAAGLVVAALVTGARVYLRATQDMASGTPAKSMPAPPDAGAAKRQQVLNELATVAPLAAPSALGSELLTRGQERTAAGEPAAAELLPAFHAYNRGDYDGAAKAFAQLAERYPKSALPTLYLGVSQIELHEDAAALQTLQLVAGAAGATADAEWYAAVAAARVGDASAAGRFRRVCQMDSGYRAQACKLAESY